VVGTRIETSKASWNHPTQRGPRIPQRERSLARLVGPALGARRTKIGALEFAGNGKRKRAGVNPVGRARARARNELFVPGGRTRGRIEPDGTDIRETPCRARGKALCPDDRGAGRHLIFTRRQTLSRGEACSPRRRLGRAGPCDLYGGPTLPGRVSTPRGDLRRLISQDTAFRAHE